MLIDVHAHFYTPMSNRADWRAYNDRRIAAGEKIGITHHVASILGTWGFRSPTYFPSPGDLAHANEYMLDLQRTSDGRVLGYCVVNPNFQAHATDEIERRLGQGMIGVKLAASRRADDPLLDPIAELAGARGVPILHHIWQHRRRDWPGQEASDGSELVALAARHPGTNFLLAHIGGGGDWSHSIRAVRTRDNIVVDLSGSGVDLDMVHHCLNAVGPERLVWGTDLTMDTGWGKLRYLESLGLGGAGIDLVRAGNARRIFPPGAFDAGD
jgi:uncharacterized protein